MSPSRRLFVALMLGPELGATVETAVLRSLGGAARAAESARVYTAVDLHVTLFFLGAVDEPWIAPLTDGLAKVASEIAAPEVELGRTGAFPSQRRPRILWVDAVERGGARLAELAARVDGACAGLGFARDERQWRAHLTVARLRGGVPAGLDAFFALEFGVPWKPAALSLVESVPGGGPPAYRRVASFALRPS